MAAVTCGVVLVLGLVGGVGRAASADEETMVLSGRVTDAKGAAEAGATVHVFVEPSASETLKVGESLTITAVGTARTDASGNYAVRNDRSLDLARHADRSGQVNMNVVVQADSGSYETLVQQVLPAAVSGARRSAAARATTIKPMREDIRLDRVDRLSAGRPQAAAARASNAVEPAAQLTIKVLKDYGGRKTVVGTWFSTMKNVTQRFTYGQSAKSSLGVAFSTSGKAGTFSAGKTKSIATTASLGFGRQKGKGRWRFNTLFHYQKRHHRFCGGYICTNSYRIEPIAWWGGASRSKAPAYAAKYCVPMPKGTNWTIKTTAAWTFKKGVEAGGMTVVNLSSKTGFSNAVKQTIAFKSRGRLCGKNSHPGKAPRALRAKPR